MGGIGRQEHSIVRTLGRAATWLLPVAIAACGSNSDGAGAGSGGTGGAGAGPIGSAGSPGAGGSASLSGACQALVNHEVSVCGENARASDQATCSNATTLYEPEGCGNAWNAFLTCATTAPVDCMKGPTGCDTQKSGYSQCQEQFVFMTGCNRDTSDDAKCAGATPFAFLCTKLPATCVALAGGAATAACCAEFPAR